MDIFSPEAMFKMHRYVKQKQAKQAIHMWRTWSCTDPKTHAIECIKSQTWYSV